MEALEGLTPSGLEQPGRPEGRRQLLHPGQDHHRLRLVFQLQRGPGPDRQPVCRGPGHPCALTTPGRTFAKVTRVSDPENGQVNVTFFSKDYGPQVTALRSQDVEIITPVSPDSGCPSRPSG